MASGFAQGRLGKWAHVEFRFKQDVHIVGGMMLARLFQVSRFVLFVCNLLSTALSINQQARPSNTRPFWMHSIEP